MEDCYKNCAVTLDLLHSCHAHAPGADIEKYFACFSQQGRFLGTDGTESWTIDDFRRYSEPFFGGGGQTAPFAPRSGSRKFTSFPPNSPMVVAFDEILECEGMKTQARGTGSLVWDQEQNKWLIFLYHLSIPVPNEVADRVCTLTRSAIK
jgi:hypothetical protein